MARNAKTERDKIAAKARKAVTDPAVKAEWQSAWSRVLRRLEPVYEARRPRMKSFEVHHSNEKAREAMLRALVAGRPMAECEEAAFAAVLPPCPVPLPPSNLC